MWPTNLFVVAGWQSGPDFDQLVRTDAVVDAVEDVAEVGG